jgi:hypothetical protein
MKILGEKSSFYASSIVHLQHCASHCWEPGAAGAEIKWPPGAEIKLPSGAGAVIMNYDSGSGSAIFYQRFEKILQNRSNVAEECKNIQSVYLILFFVGTF